MPSPFRSVVFLCLIFVLGALTPFGISESHAQTATSESVDIQPIIDRARETGMSVIVISPEEKQQAEVEAGPDLQTVAFRVRSELIRIFSKAPELGSAIYNTLERVSPDGTLLWLAIAVATSVGGIAAGTVPSILVRNWTRDTFQKLYSEDVTTRAEKITYLMFRAFTISLNLLTALGVGVLVAIIFDAGHPPSRGTIGAIFGSYMAYRFFRHVIFFNIIAPDAPSHRLINLNDEDAEMMQRDWRNIAMVVIAICGFFVWLALLGLPGDALKLLVICSLFVSALLIGGLFLKHKSQFTGIFLGEGDPTNKPWWQRLIASQWHLIIIGYLIVAWLVSTFRVIMELPSALAVIGAPVVALICGIAAFGFVVILIDRFYNVRKARFEEKVQIAHEQKQRQDALDQAAFEESQAGRSEDDDEEMIINQVMSSKEMDEMPVFKPIFKSLLEEAAGILIMIIGFAFVLSAWDINIGERGNPVTGFIDTLAVIFFAWFLYRLVVVYIDNQLEEEGGYLPVDTGEPGEEMSGQSTSRLATLLPLLRNVLVASIAVLSGMIILSNMGVDIAPLFAGAGVIGLAVGFGAQTLIRDIFSGGFFLFDDAFRKGEYIELGTIRGTVEKISLRSFQLRHHNGPLHTVPFGEITQLTNYSRDWVMMKLPLRVTYDTDVEKLRKLLKKLGQSLLEHPEVGHLFLQPLKSQGVYKMEDSAMIVRVKFMTKPGDQFVTRKVVYAAIRDLFEKENIHFANKEVTVRLAEEPKTPLTDNEKTAIAAAARRVTDDEAAAQAGGEQTKDDGP